jgi:hypothetical protein
LHSNDLLRCGGCTQLAGLPDGHHGGLQNETRGGEIPRVSQQDQEIRDAIPVKEFFVWIARPRASSRCPPAPTSGSAGRAIHVSGKISNEPRLRSKAVSLVQFVMR